MDLMSDWIVQCVRTSLDGAVTHIGVDVPRGTQHVPVDEAIAAIGAGLHRFYVEQDGDRLMLRPMAGNRLGTSRDGTGPSLLADLADCGTGARFHAGADA